MHASHIDDLVARVLAGHNRYRLALRTAARQGSGARSVVVLPFWSKPRVALSALALLTCAAMARADNPNASARSSPVAAASDPTATLPLAVGPAHVRPDIRPLLSDDDRLAALQEGKRLRSLDPASAAALARSIQPVMASSAKTVPTAAVPVDGVAAYALVTDVTRTRIASELRQQLMGSSATVGNLPGTPRAELMQVDTGWRAVVWPFATENEADKARRMLAERGIRTELLKF